MLLLYKNDPTISIAQRLKNKKPSWGSLRRLFQANFLYERLVTILALALEIVQVLAAIRNHLEESATRVIILAVLL